MNNIINNMYISELETYFLDLGEKKFRAKQLFEAIHKQKIKNLDKLTTFSQDLKDKINNSSEIYGVKKVLELKSKLDETKKYLFELHDENVIESVLMKYKYGYTVCISTQVGCKMGCAFCASTKKGLIRNLYASEMLDEIYEIERLNDINVSNIVLMGSGEALDNFDELIRFIELISAKEGKNLSKRNITISTCGLADKILKLAEYDYPITLTISLHNADEEERKKIMPITRKYPFDELIPALKEYQAKINKRISFEYVLIDGLNDSYQSALDIKNLLKDIKSHINLIPLNKIKEYDEEPSTSENINKFKKYLEDFGFNVTIRRELGADINASCGQLRNNYLEQ
ncbi:23S rRNA (adenine(2503)-C(2))-methyltransferase RlmN [Fenollaria massiliensis]|uniref:Probable dual-specificity RNA methyltransferase RlmN n=1 Tax=Fenollaria massiliensis TaxID=938288 RepID=A0A9E7DKH8_9FIRM|nr:23S rRNA (adenine(2503)-C(2))-methyltransferase RlmN [Fenollaria massiliensis]UQK59638.1 23S rRNA (adenine(2503)-C(2))-methyltransferase RlmN [Fenollaria massiliensis]